MHVPVAGGKSTVSDLGDVCIALLSERLVRRKS